MTILNVYVPVANSLHCNEIKTGSAIVSAQTAIDPNTDTMLISYEGNVYDSENLKHFHDRTVIAAARLIRRYPTVAKRGVSRDQLILVATFDTDVWAFNEIVDATKLGEWAGEAIEEISGLRVANDCVDWNLAAAAAVGGHYISLESANAGALFRTIAGQYLLFNKATSSVEVLDKNDPRCKAEPRA